MKFLILNAYDLPYIADLYRRNTDLDKRPYVEQLQAHTNLAFFTADFYSTNLRRLGDEAEDIIINSPKLQQQWAAENGLGDLVSSQEHSPSPRLLKTFVKRLIPEPARRVLRNIVRTETASPEKTPDHLSKILAAQIKRARPDVVINVAMSFTSSVLMNEIRPYTRLLIGQTGWPVAQGESYNSYDLILSSLPNFVEEFRQQGLPSQLFRLGFEPSILARLKTPRKEATTVFIGALTCAHRERVELLEYLCDRVPMTVWGYTESALAGDSAIGKCWKGLSWGLQTYQILADTKIALNMHADFAKDFANNIRLYETTGVGTMLLTDSKKNLADMFHPGKEVIGYRNREECAELIEYFLKHEEERQSIASAGQKRTLENHTYYHRMQELQGIVQKVL
jgi:hypothetical protein